MNLHSSPWGWTQIPIDELERLKKIEKMFWELREQEHDVFSEWFNLLELEQLKNERPNY